MSIGTFILTLRPDLAFHGSEWYYRVSVPLLSPLSNGDVEGSESSHFEDLTLTQLEVEE